jgi:hypothetical protein
LQNVCFSSFSFCNFFGYLLALVFAIRAELIWISFIALVFGRSLWSHEQKNHVYNRQKKKKNYRRKKWKNRVEIRVKVGLIYIYIYFFFAKKHLLFSSSNAYWLYACALHEKR